jgi:hypothetical protein
MTSIGFLTTHSTHTENASARNSRTGGAPQGMGSGDAAWIEAAHYMEDNPGPSSRSPAAGFANATTEGHFYYVGQPSRAWKINIDTRAEGDHVQRIEPGALLFTNS